MNILKKIHDRYVISMIIYFTICMASGFITRLAGMYIFEIKDPPFVPSMVVNMVLCSLSFWLIWHKDYMDRFIDWFVDYSVLTIKNINNWLHS